MFQYTAQRELKVPLLSIQLLLNRRVTIGSLSQSEFNHEFRFWSESMQFQLFNNYKSLQRYNYYFRSILIT